MRVRARSIGLRLARVVVTAVFVGVMSSVSFFLLSEFRQTVLAEQARLRSSAAAFAAAAAPSVKAFDRRSALLILRGIRELPELRYAALRDTEGRLVAEIGHTATLVGRDGLLEEAGLFSMLSAETLDAAIDVRDGGLVIGKLVLNADITALRDRYLSALRFSVLFGLALMAVTALVAWRQIARIVQPLGHLAGEFADIGRRSDLTRRLRKEREDEVGVLVDAFNEMFGHIEGRDTELKRHRDTLEDTVEARTAEMRAAKNDAERANAAKSDFLATMSHEIRTPMNGMMVMAEMLSAAPLAPKHLRYAEIIARSGRGLLNIINDILDFSKIEAGMLTLEATPFALDALIEDTASLFAERAREKGLTVALTVDPALPRRLIGDPTRISQVVGNLLNNALKFTETGGVTIDVVAGGHDASGATVEVHVRDTGIGIAADTIDRIFERFSQADGTITRRFGGTGLGLSISRRFVEAMGGRLQVESTPGQGSDFHFAIVLPVEELAQPTVGFANKRVQVAAESPIAAAAIQKTLLAYGARSVREGQKPDLILVQSGCENGIDDDPSIPVVALGGFATAGRPVRHGVRLDGELSLPLRRAEIEALAEAASTGAWELLRSRSAAQAVSARLPDHGHLSVLAVDDTAVNREVLAEALGGFNIAPDMATSGAEAIAAVGRHRFDVIFMDCSMPDMDGFAATEAIREIERRDGRRPAFVVALTAHVTGREAARWSEAGMDAYVAKPFTIAQLQKVLAGARPLETDDASPGTERAELPIDRPARIDFAAEPLLSSETLGMFETLSAAKGRMLAERIFGLFGTHAPPAFAKLAAERDGPAAEVAKLAHALKSMCLSAGAGRAGAVCGEIEAAAKRDEVATDEAIADLDRAIAATRTAMADYLAGSTDDGARASA